MLIRNIQKTDATRLADIYNHYIRTSVYTYDEKECGEGFFLAKMETLPPSCPFIGAEADGELIGYAYASLFRPKPAYKYTAETTIYFDYRSAGRGYGKELYRELLVRLKAAGFKMAIGVLGLPNPASERLHRHFGFRNAGTLHKVGRKFDKWLDTGYWELDLEKFSV